MAEQGQAREGSLRLLDRQPARRGQDVPLPQSLGGNGGRGASGDSLPRRVLACGDLSVHFLMALYHCNSIQKYLPSGLQIRTPSSRLLLQTRLALSVSAQQVLGAQPPQELAGALRGG